MLKLPKKKRNRKGSGSLFQKTPGGLWHMQYYRTNPDTGLSERVRECTQTRDQNEAQTMLNERLVQISRGELFEVGKRVTVARLYEALHTAIENDNRRPRAAKGLEWRWKHLKPAFGHVFAAAVTTERIEKYKTKRREERATRATINRELAVLRRMFRYAMNEHRPPLVHNVPPIRLFSEKGNERRGFVEQAAYERMVTESTRPEVLDVDGLWLRALLEAAYTYGWRRSELISLRVRQLNFLEREISLDPGTTKNDEGRVVHMTDTVYEWFRVMSEGKGAEDFVFTRKNGKPVKEFRAAWQNLCIRAAVHGPDGKPSRYECGKCQAPMRAGRKICRACGGERRYIGLLVHDMRRSAARALRRAGVPESVIMKTGGWKTHSMFDRYNITNKRDQRDAMAKLEEYRQMERAACISPSSAPLGSETALEAATPSTEVLQ
jgi:integrase